MSVINPSMAYQLAPQSDGTFVCFKGNGNVIAIRNGGIVDEPFDPNARAQRCKRDGAFLVYDPDNGGTLFYVQP